MKREEAKSVQILRELKDDILFGRYSGLSRFPSETALSRRFGVSRSLVASVVGELEHLGFVTRSQGRGTFVSRGAVSRKIGLIVPGIACTDFFQPIVSEINQLARQESYHLLFAEVFSSERAKRVRQVCELAAEFIKEQVAGVIYEPLAEPGGKEANERILQAFAAAGVPVVLLDCDIVPFPQRSGYDVVGVNDVEAGAKIIRHLLSVGAKKIHFLISQLCPTTFLNRLYGAECELSRAQLFGRGCVLKAEPDDLTALRRHIRRHGKPDAFVCSNDPSAALFRQTLEKAGLLVPRDVLLTGFANMPIASLMSPPLTTIHQNRDQMGGAAFRRLLQRMETPGLPANEILFPSPLIVRESTSRQKVGRKSLCKLT